MSYKKRKSRLYKRRFFLSTVCFSYFLQTHSAMSACRFHRTATVTQLHVAKPDVNSFYNDLPSA